MIFCDGGTAYSKIYNSITKEFTIIPTKDLIKNKNRHFDFATGHSSKNVCSSYVNELISLAEGSLELIPDRDFTVLDIGSRDMKCVTFKNRKLHFMDWNNTCGGNMGFTVEILGNYYNINYEYLLPANKSIPVACGLLGIEKVFDEINKGLQAEASVAKFIKGLAKISFSFAQKPCHLYLSGGFINNRCFVDTLREYTNVNLLGRDVLINGLIRIARQNKQLKYDYSINYHSKRD